MGLGCSMTELESSNEKSKWGGARPGAGRPEGSMNPDTKERMKVKSAFISRVNKHADDLFNAQYNLAKGETYLMVKRIEGEGKNRKVWHEMVTDPQTIIEYLDGELQGNDSIDDDEHFYYMTTKPANGLAIDSLLNRSFGKAEEKLDITSDGEKLDATPSPEIAAAFAEFMRSKK